jgi:hypothetical protein
LADEAVNLRDAGTALTPVLVMLVHKDNSAGGERAVQLRTALARDIVLAVYGQRLTRPVAQAHAERACERLYPTYFAQR